jgi:hypothetical protein
MTRMTEKESQTKMMRTSKALLKRPLRKKEEKRKVLLLMRTRSPQSKANLLTQRNTTPQRDSWKPIWSPLSYMRPHLDNATI